MPWALGTNDDTVAYLFATQLVAGPRVDGSQNKVLWEAKDSPSGAMCWLKVVRWANRNRW